MKFFAKRNNIRYIDLVKIVNVGGLKVTFMGQPAPAPGSHYLIMSTYVSNIGSMQKAQLAIGMDEKSFRRLPFKKLAKDFAEFCMFVGSIKDREYDELKTLVSLVAPREAAATDMAVNASIIRLCYERGVVVQPVGGYQMKDVVGTVLGPKAEQLLRPNAAPSAQPPQQPAKQTDAPTPGTVKKQTVH